MQSRMDYKIGPKLSLSQADLSYEQPEWFGSNMPCWVTGRIEQGPTSPGEPESTRIRIQQG